MKKHTEARLEDAIVDHLVTEGGYTFVDYREGEAKGRYDKARALDPTLVLGFTFCLATMVSLSLTLVLVFFSPMLASPKCDSRMILASCRRVTSHDLAINHNNPVSCICGV